MRERSWRRTVAFALVTGVLVAGFSGGSLGRMLVMGVLLTVLGAMMHYALEPVADRVARRWSVPREWRRPVTPWGRRRLSRLAHGRPRAK